MTKSISIQSPLAEDVIRQLHTGDIVLLSGTMITGRDVAHRRLYETLQRDEKPPVDIIGQTIFYAAPTPSPPGRVIGSVGPTTAYRMDAFTPFLLSRGLRAMIGKGKRSDEVREAIRRYKAVYFGAMGGVAALLSRCVTSAEIVAYDDLGPEAIMRLEVLDFPLVVINDATGRDLYEETIIAHS